MGGHFEKMVLVLHGLRWFTFIQFPREDVESGEYLTGEEKSGGGVLNAIGGGEEMGSGGRGVCNDAAGYDDAAAAADDDDDDDDGDGDAIDDGGRGTVCDVCCGAASRLEGGRGER